MRLSRVSFSCGNHGAAIMVEEAGTDAADLGDAANMDAADTVDLIDVRESFSDEEDVDVTDAELVDATDADADADVVDAVLLDSASFIFRTLLL